MNNDFLKWAALAAALIATASAEYELARAVGFNDWVAAAVPGALDIYTVRAMRAHKDVLAAVAAMILVNAASHLVTAGLLPVNVPLVVAVAAIAPLVLWRVHRLVPEGDEKGTHSVRTPGVPEPAEYAAEPEAEPVPVVPEPVREIPAAVPEGARLLPIVARPVPAVKALAPAAEYTRTRTAVHAEYVPEPAPDWTVDGTYADADSTVPGADEEPTYPDPLIPQVRADFPDQVPGVRRLKETYSIGQPRAQRIRDELMGVAS